jgi:hypothetical protein
MHVNVIHATRLQLDRVIRTQEGVQNSLGTAFRRFLPMQQYPRQQAGNTLPAPQNQSESPQEYRQPDRLQADNVGYSVFTSCPMRFFGLPYTARNHVNSPFSQFKDFLSDIWLYCRGKLIGEIGYR